MIAIALAIESFTVSCAARNFRRVALYHPESARRHRAGFQGGRRGANAARKEQGNNMANINMAKNIGIVFLAAVAAMSVGARPVSADTSVPAPAAGVRHAAFSGDRAASPAHGDEAGKLLRCPARVPAALDPPAGTTLTAGMAASGVQVYVCAGPATAAGAPAWVLKGPHAVLSEGKETTATHFSGPAPVPPVAAKVPGAAAASASAPATAPTWEALDGSRLTGAKVASAAAPDGKSIPWLLLRSTSSVGSGLFGDVTWVQRLDTAGGAAPATGCDAAHVGAEAMVPYHADYFFYHASAAGTAPRRCASN